MKYIFLLSTLIFTTHAIARIKHLSYEEQVERMQDLRKKQNTINITNIIFMGLLFEY